jgi:hypothetical protein
MDASAPAILEPLIHGTITGGYMDLLKLIEDAITNRDIDEVKALTQGHRPKDFTQRYPEPGADQGSRDHRRDL